MRPSKTTKRILLAERLERLRPAIIAETEWRELMTELAPVSENYLRKLLRESGVPLAPLVQGVRQDSFEQLEKSLLDIGREYAAAMAAGDRVRARACRRLVITAKDHARLAARSPKASPEKRAAKEEMALWLLTWLENPGVFETWAGLRKLAAQMPPQTG